jgi:hypothetical protein
LLAFIETFGAQPKANITDIHRKYQGISQMKINYKPFHNQIKKVQCTELFKNIFEGTMKTWIVKSLKLTSLTSLSSVFQLKDGPIQKHLVFRPISSHDSLTLPFLKLML